MVIKNRDDSVPEVLPEARCSNYTCMQAAPGLGTNVMGIPMPIATNASGPATSSLQ